LRKISLKRSSKFILKLCLGLALLNFNSCGFAYEEKVTGKYYIIGVDTKEDLGLCYRLGGGNYIGKAPGLPKKYGFNDTFLVVKTKQIDRVDEMYYIINMSKDNAYAHEADFRIGPLSEVEFARTWNSRLNIKFNTIK
jgi:hypothetical protein